MSIELALGLAAIVIVGAFVLARRGRARSSQSRPRETTTSGDVPLMVAGGVGRGPGEKAGRTEPGSDDTGDGGDGAGDGGGGD